MSKGDIAFTMLMLGSAAAWAYFAFKTASGAYGDLTVDIPTLATIFTSMFFVAKALRVE